MASIDWFPKAPPIPTHNALVVTPLTLWQCTSFQDPCLTLKFMTIDPKDINNSVLSLFIPPSHNRLKKLVLSDTINQESCKLLSLLACLGGNHSAPLNVPPYRNFLNLAGVQIFNTWYTSDGRTISHVFQYYSTTTPILRELSRSGRNYQITKLTKGRASFEGSLNTCPPGFPHSSRSYSLPRWRYELVINTSMSLFIW